MNKKLFMTRTLAIAVSLSVITGICAGCDSKNSARVIKATEMTGTVTYSRANEEKDVYLNMNFEVGDDVVTAAESTLDMRLDADKYVHMFENTEIVMECSGGETDGKTLITLKSGEIFNDITVKLSGEAEYEIRTSNATIGVRGTTFYVKSSGERTIAYCEDGVVNVKTDGSELDIAAGEAAVADGEQITLTPLEEIRDELELMSGSAAETTTVAETTADPGEELIFLKEMSVYRSDNGAYDKISSETYHYTDEWQLDYAVYTYYTHDLIGGEKVIYEYDENGRLLSEALAPSLSERNYTKTYEYDESGRLIKMQMTGTEEYSVTYKYDEDGKKGWEIYSTGTEVGYRYGDDGKLISISVQIDEGNGLVRTGLFAVEYDSKGRKIKSANEKMDRIRYEYNDETNRPSKIICENEDTGEEYTMEMSYWDPTV